MSDDTKALIGIVAGVWLIIGSILCIIIKEKEKEKEFNLKMVDKGFIYIEAHWEKVK